MNARNEISYVSPWEMSRRGNDKRVFWGAGYTALDEVKVDGKAFSNLSGKEYH